MSFRVTLACNRAQAESLPDPDQLASDNCSPPVLVADEPDPAKPDEWLIHAYFDHSPSAEELAQLALLGTGEPQFEELGEDDWVTMSQSGLQPIRAGRFFVHTPTHRGSAPPGSIAFEIDASLAFGTGQHATTAGCLEALDRLQRNDCRFTNIADIGTGTGLLAFAAMALWRRAGATASDIDAVCAEVVSHNAALNQIPLGARGGELTMVIAPGMDDALLRARGPYDLLIANILANPLIELAPDFANSVSPGGNLLLAGLLQTQEADVRRSYRRAGFRLASRLVNGDWSILWLRRR